MPTSVILFFSGCISFLAIIVGIIAGWHINDIVYAMNRNDEVQGHPEMYDEDGIWINEELLSVKFVKDEEDEDDYY